MSSPVGDKVTLWALAGTRRERACVAGSSIAPTAGVRSWNAQTAASESHQFVRVLAFGRAQTVGAGCRKALTGVSECGSFVASLFENLP